MCRVVTFDSFFTIISLSAHKHIVIVSNWTLERVWPFWFSIFSKFPKMFSPFKNVFSCFFVFFPCVFFTLFHTKYLEKNNNFEFRKWSTRKTNNLTCPSGLPYLEEVAAPNCISTLLNINLKKLLPVIFFVVLPGHKFNYCLFRLWISFLWGLIKMLNPQKPNPVHSSQLSISDDGLLDTRRAGSQTSSAW